MFLDGMMGASHIELGCHLWSFCCCFGVLPKLLKDRQSLLKLEGVKIENLTPYSSWKEFFIF